MESRLLWETGSSTERVDILLLAEGYTVSEQNAFFEDANRFTQHLLTNPLAEPFYSYSGLINIQAAFEAST